MSMVQLGALQVSQTSYNRAREIVNNRPQGTRKSTDEVLESLRKMMPGWTISTSKADWTEGVRNIEIDYRVLERMAEDPDTMVKFKALIMDLEDAVPDMEQWTEENPGYSMTFGFEMAQNGALRAIAIVEALMGGPQIRTVFDLPRNEGSQAESNQGTWASMISQQLAALAEGRVYDEDGNRSWVV